MCIRDSAYAAVLGGCVGTANCLAEMKFGSEVKAVGTVAHLSLIHISESGAMPMSLRAMEKSP